MTWWSGTRGTYLANLLSAARLPLAGLIWVAPDRPWWALSIMGIAALTDVLDGWVARRVRQKKYAAGDPTAYASGATRGEVIDGFADKVFVASTVTALFFVTQPPIMTLAVLMARELLLAPLVALERLARPSRSKTDFTANKLGKLTTVVQFVAVGLGFLSHPFFTATAWAAGVLGVGTVLIYAVRTLLARHRAD